MEKKGQMLERSGAQRGERIKDRGIYIILSYIKVICVCAFFLVFL